MDATAASRIFQVKQRPADNPLIVHVDGLQMLRTRCGLEVDAIYKALIERFWPGPLTILLRKPQSNISEKRVLTNSQITQKINAAHASGNDGNGKNNENRVTIPREVSQSEMVAVRFPRNPIARALIHMSGCPLVNITFLL